VANGRSRGAAFSVEAVKAQWMRFLLFRVMPEAAAWHGRRHGVEARFAQLRCIARQKNSNPSDSSVASSSNCSDLLGWRPRRHEPRPVVSSPSDAARQTSQTSGGLVDSGSRRSTMTCDRPERTNDRPRWMSALLASRRPPLAVFNRTTGDPHAENHPLSLVLEGS
jgi:hypothetical protein